MNRELMVVDDEAGIRKILGYSLQDLGYTVHTAASGEEALSLLETVSPAIILTDIKMPGMDGITLLKKIKKQHPDIEVIMITGHGDMKLAIKSLKYEAVDFITKPIDDDVLEIALNRADEKIRMREKIRAYTENLEKTVQEQSKRLVELECQNAVGQAVEGLTGALKQFGGDTAKELSVLNAFPFYVSVLDKNLTIVAANERYQKGFGKKPGDSGRTVYCQEQGAKTGCPAARTFKEKESQRVETMALDANGAKRPVMVYTAPIKTREGDVGLVVEIASDIQEVNRLEKELRQARQEYRRLFDEVPCYIAVIDKNFRLVKANTLFKNDFGDPGTGFCYRVFKQKDTPCEECPVRKTFIDGRCHNEEMQVISRHGREYHVLVWTAAIRNEQGEITEVMEMATNITEIRQLQNHLASLGLKIGAISHGIKGLLTGLDGGLYMVESGFKRNDLQRLEKGWDTVKGVAAKIRKLVLDILYFAKERPLSENVVDANELARDVAGIVFREAKNQAVDYVVDTAETPLPVKVDEDAVSAALVNILENAREACAADTDKTGHRISFSVFREKDVVCFKIADNGIGMTPMERENLFALFYSSKGHKGTGLGLFIASRIISQHKGAIQVESSPGKGTTFLIQLPALP